MANLGNVILAKVCTLIVKTPRVICIDITFLKVLDQKHLNFRLSIGESGIVRNNTETNFKARILKYEKFEPPHVTSLSSSNLDLSPTEIETLPKLDMDLLPELHDVIYKKSSTLPQHPPKVNRQVGALHFLASFLSMKKIRGKSVEKTLF